MDEKWSLYAWYLTEKGHYVKLEVKLQANPSGLVIGCGFTDKGKPCMFFADGKGFVEGEADRMIDPTPAPQPAEPPR